MPALVIPHVRDASSTSNRSCCNEGAHHGVTNISLPMYFKSKLAGRKNATIQG